MFWGGSKKNDGAEVKDRMLRELRSAFPSLRRPNNDDTVYELLFEVDQKYNTLRVFFSPDFPASRPVLQVVGTISHPSLDQYKRVVGNEKVSTSSHLLIVFVPCYPLHGICQHKPMVHIAVECMCDY